MVTTYELQQRKERGPRRSLPNQRATRPDARHPSMSSEHGPGIKNRSMEGQQAPDPGSKHTLYVIVIMPLYLCQGGVTVSKL